MDWPALTLSLRLGALTLLILIPAMILGRWLALTRARGKGLIEALLALPLVLPSTVIGFHLLTSFGAALRFGQAYQSLFNHSLLFTFEGLLVASVIVNIPFAVQPTQRAFEAIGPKLRKAAETCAMSWWRMFWRIELPLAWPGVLTGAVPTFAHTLGEFGVDGRRKHSRQDKTIAISIYDRVQAFDEAAAGRMAAVLLAISLSAIALSYVFTREVGRTHA